MKVSHVYGSPGCGCPWQGLFGDGFGVLLNFCHLGGAGSQWDRSRLESNHLGLLKAESSSWDPGGSRPSPHGTSRQGTPTGDPHWICPRGCARGPARWWEGSSWPQNALPSSGAELGGAQLPKSASLVAESLLSIGNEIRGVIPSGGVSGPPFPREL